MSADVLGFQEVDRASTGLVGGKGANLGELSRIDGLRVPEGFCISTHAFAKVVGEAPALDELLRRLAGLDAQEREELSEVSRAIREAIVGLRIPEDIEAAITRALTNLGEKQAFAVRSSATTEDLPTASFAGQHQTYLNVIGTRDILKRVSQCWASLFTERAVMYRLQNGFEHRDAQLAVIVQKMVFPRAAGVLFTADPITSNRKVSSIDASFGLGEALVSGLVNADSYQVRDGAIIGKRIAPKKLAIAPLPSGGTEQRAVEAEQQTEPALTDEQITRLERLGRRVEAHFGSPQDIEWALVDDAFFVLQSRPITTLFPIPEARDQDNHVYISVGHQQMMTQAMRPLGLSFFQLTAGSPMTIAGSRLFVDVTRHLASPANRETLVNVLGASDPLLRGALTAVLERRDFIKPVSDDGASKKPISPGGFRTQVTDDPAIVSQLIEQSRASTAALARDIQSKSGPELFDFIREDIQQLKKSLSDPRSTSVFLAAMDASAWLNENMKTWLGEKNAADALSQSVPNNITSEMGLDLLKVADVLRGAPEVIHFLRQPRGDDFLEELVTLAGGQQARDAITAYLDTYGMRCAGEIDITNARWSEKPATLLPLILSNIKNFEPNASQRRFEQGRQGALSKERELLGRLKQLPDGERKADETRRMISLLRNFIGYREYPKYSMMSRFFIYKQALLKEAATLARANVIRDTEDIYSLTFEELQEVVRTHTLDLRVLRERRRQHALHERLTPPRVITSDGDVPAGSYQRDGLPAGALVGLAVSSGVVEGRARVISSMTEAELGPEDILVTTFTDPSWTPLFVAIKGLVTEVGGLMTHGAVIAREYGLPAVVGVEHATSLIKDGQRVRVHGTEGYVEVLS